MQILCLKDTNLTMTSAQAVQLIEALLKSKTGKQLTRLEKEIFKAAWDNETYSSVAENLYLSIGHTRDIASELWQNLSEAFGEKFTKNNLRCVVEKLCTTSTFSEKQRTPNKTDGNSHCKGNILLVDDLIENLRFLTELLTQQGHKVRCVTSGKMALRTIHNNPPDVILLAIKIPEMDGYEVCQSLKAYRITSEIPVILLSDLDEITDKTKAFKVGAVDYISTPFQSEEIIAKIQTQLTIQKQKSQLKQKIEEYQHTTKTLNHYRNLLTNLLHNSQDGILAVQAVRDKETEEIKDFCCLLVNPFFAQLFGQKRTELMGKSSLKRLIHQVTPTLYDSLVDVVESGEAFQQKFCLKNNNQQIWYHLTALKFGDGCSITVTQITKF